VWWRPRGFRLNQSAYMAKIDPFRHEKIEHLLHNIETDILVTINHDELSEAIKSDRFQIMTSNLSLMLNIYICNKITKALLYRLNLNQ
jgi:hypothetical protein